jgi:hypothetical protein
LKTTLYCAAFACTATLCTPAWSQQFSVAAFRASARTTEIRTEKVADGFYVLFGVGGNIAASIGPQGVLIVDTQFAEMVAKYKTAIRELGGAKKPLIDGGATLEQVLAARVTAEWDQQRGNPTTFLSGSFASLAR